MALICGLNSYAQSSIKAVLLDSATGEPVSFATVSLTKQGAAKASSYVLSSDDGAVNIAGVKKGSYTIKAEILGYKPLTREITVSGATLDLGKLEMIPDAEQLQAAKVSATGNPIIIKKDTIEYNASSFKTTDNDVL